MLGWHWHLISAGRADVVVAGVLKIVFILIIVGQLILSVLFLLLLAG